MNKLNLHTISVAILTTSIVSFFGSSAYGQEIKDFKYTAECTSKGTEVDGKRNSCTSEWSEHTVPSNFVYNETSLNVYYQGKNGSSNRCDVEWDNFVELIPGTGITMPQTLRIRAHARSPKAKFPTHNTGARGWSECVFEGQYTKFR